MKYIYITNDTKIAEICQKIGIGRIFIDLELRGKLIRQGGMDTVISRHQVSDIGKIHGALNENQNMYSTSGPDVASTPAPGPRPDIMVRINSVYEGTGDEVDACIREGADLIMLPYYKSIHEVRSFLTAVNKRVKTVLLIETVEAVELLEETIALSKDLSLPIDEFYIGLNDLHLEMKKHFMFEILSDGTLERITNILKANKYTFGFGGLARLGAGDIPAESVLAEHLRIGSSRVILARSFFHQTPGDHDEAYYIDAENTMTREYQKILDYEGTLKDKPPEFFEKNKNILYEKINGVVKRLLT